MSRNHITQFAVLVVCLQYFSTSAHFLSALLPNCWALESEAWESIPIQAEVRGPEPGTGLVAWDDSEHVDSPAIQLEFSYLQYADVLVGPHEYDWGFIDKKLDAIASRKHQAVLRFFDTYVGKPSGVPLWIRQLPGYQEQRGKSEGKMTSFPDWSNATYQQAMLDFFQAFAERYDKDPRIAYLQVGFGLWAEYHIYDGVMELGKTFPSMEYQATFLRHLDSKFNDLPWMISIDAADDETTPIVKQPELLKLRFGLFDDSFLSKEHPKVNAVNWRAFGSDRYQTHPCGGEFSYYNKNDQKKALATEGPNGMSFEEALDKFHLSFIIANDQFNYQKLPRLVQASRAMGFELRLEKLERRGNKIQGTFVNQGVAPVYVDAYPTVIGIRSMVSLKNLQPLESRSFLIEVSDDVTRIEKALTITSDRLLPGVTIPFNADIK